MLKPGILNAQGMKSDFNWKLQNLNMGFTSYLTCVESLSNLLYGYSNNDRTNFKGKYLSFLNDFVWILASIPFLELPSQFSY